MTSAATSNMVFQKAPMKVTSAAAKKYEVNDWVEDLGKVEAPVKFAPVEIKDKWALCVLLLSP